MFGGLLATLTGWCEEHGIPYQGVALEPGSATPAARAMPSKHEIIAAMRARGFEPADDNEADAIAICSGPSRRTGAWHEHACRNVPQHVANVIAERSTQYGDAGTTWRPSPPVVGHAGREITPAQVVLCLLDLKLARLAHDPPTKTRQSMSAATRHSSPNSQAPRTGRTLSHGTRTQEETRQALRLRQAHAAGNGEGHHEYSDRRPRAATSASQRSRRRTNGLARRWGGSPSANSSVRPSIRRAWRSLNSISSTMPW